MKTIIIVIIALIFGYGLASIDWKPNSISKVADNHLERQKYTCGMHPEIVSDEPGYCPICEMKLTPMKPVGSSHGSVVIDPTTKQNMGMATVPVTYAPLTRSVRAFGRVDYREPSIYNVNIKVGGWVENLLVDYTGAEVNVNQPLFTIYSPLLVATQEEYLIARRMNPNGELLSKINERFRNWDISEEQIDKLNETGQVVRTMTINSPVKGVVIDKNIATGDKLVPGALVYTIANLDSVWVIAHIYEQDLPFIELGHKATVKIPNLPGITYDAIVSYISPVIDEKRQVEVRLELDNRDYQLKPDMYAEIAVHAGIPEDKPVIPRSAVINSGVKEIAFVTSGDNSYTPRIITTGIIGDNDLVEVVSGLEVGEEVVVSGQFLLDSESRLHEALNLEHLNHGMDPPKEDNIKSGKPMKHDTDDDHVHPSNIYTCTMPVHFDVLQYGLGKCYKCEMELKPIEETENTDVYFCPMTECGVVQNKPGNCSVCGMHLEKHERGKS